MSLRPAEVVAIAAELTRELAHAVVQKISAPTTTRLYLDLRVPGRTHTLVLCSDVGFARLGAIDSRPSNPPTPPTWQHVLRRELTGAALVDVEALSANDVALLHFAKADTRLTLALELATPAIALLNRDATVLSTSIPGRIRVGHRWELPAGKTPAEAPSRLQGDHVALRLAHAAEAFFSKNEQATWQRARKNPLEAKLKRLLRTKEKVRADAARVDGADFQRDGALLAQNLYRLKRGMTSVTVTEYLPSGDVAERTIALTPTRTPQEEVAWRFKQHKRLLRGAELATARLQQLDADEAELRDAMRALDDTPAEEPIGPAPRPERAEAKPYREYRGHGDQRLWVGKGAAHNDTLTFHVAKPHHLWLHARGVTGAHVVVPLEKNQTVSSEVLLDAAHLALHHSDSKHEPRGEVSWVQVKFVRSAGAPGAVTYTREKTLMLRVEPERLQRLLRTADSEPVVTSRR
ncbi:MAG: DUF814 domain-containing protein [Archangium sp.]|nr:DUF814 domain-containing protein [Archangium sp.]